jgi:peptidoglycan/xylan/chitin deacetylase (PgdA/CDA1 family)
VSGNLAGMGSEVAHGLMFHHFHSDIHPVGQGSMSEDDFRSMIKFYGRENFLDARDWFDRAVAGTLENNHVCLTFDDNLQCQYDVALPVMREFGLTGFWFVYTSVLHGVKEPLEIFRTFRSTYDSIDEFYGDFFESVAAGEFGNLVQSKLDSFLPENYLVDFPFYSDSDRRFRYVRDEVLGKDAYDSAMYSLMLAKGFDLDSVAAGLWMSAEHLRELHDGGHVVGLHSYTHPTRLGELSRAKQFAEYRANFEDLVAVLGDSPVAMSHPCNSYNLDTVEVLGEMGIQVGFRANMVKPMENYYEFPRIDHAIVLERMKAGIR